MNVGGTARYLEELIQNIPNCQLATGFVQGAEIEDPCTEEMNPLRIPHLGRKISLVNDILAWNELRKVIKELRPLVVHTHTFKAGLIGRMIIGKHKRIHTYHGHLFGDDSFSWIEKKMIVLIEKILAKRTDIIISVGKKVGTEIRSKGIGANQTWISIPPGVERLPRMDKISARKILGVSHERVLVGWLARMASVKNPFLLLEIAKRSPGIDFIMGGGGELLTEVIDSAPENVKIMGWTDASVFWSSVDFAISTSDNEGMPISLIEAQLAGLPVIATNVGACDEIIENGTTGILINNNIDNLVTAVQRLKSDSAMRSSMGAAAQKRATDNFSTTKMVKLHYDIYFSDANKKYFQI